MAQGGNKKKTLTVDKRAAWQNLTEALQLATESDNLPGEWIARSRQVGKASNATNTPVLGVALLAKATNKDVAALALQTKVHRGYSPRGLAKSVFVPFCVEHEIDLRTTGAEPFNNNPFYNKTHIHKDLIPENKVTARAELEYLIDCLEVADFLEGDTALRALAAFLKVRIEDGNKATILQLEKNSLTLPEISDLIEKFINQNREGGKRGQALVAACFDLVHPDKVYSGAINDPSRKVPGDVTFEIPQDSPAGTLPIASVADFANRIVILSGEAKQKIVMESEVLQFVDRLAASGIGKALYVAVHPNQKDLDPEALSRKAQERSGVLLHVITDPKDLIRSAIQWSPLSLSACLQQLPQLLVERLKDFHCGKDSQQEWADMLAD
ncbi:restriction endonuclease, SacI family [Kitasatospora sp. NPDC097605]|uniref:restriction endonuclease, SacI family n=1 Tax=Kitasatospora sp. NPDC097605 TaxID=3157226 RepID=UPI00332F89C6